MGIDKVVLEAIILSHTYLPPEKRKNALGLARQQFHISPQIMHSVFQKYGINFPLDLCREYSGKYFENFFANIGYTVVDSIDNSAYENATIIHNLNLPLSLTVLENMYLMVEQ